MQLPYSTPFEEFGGLVGEIPQKAFYAWDGISEQKLFQALTDFSEGGDLLLRRTNYVVAIK